MDVSYSPLQRNTLKSRLQTERVTFTIHGYRPQCANCGLGVLTGFDMHEVFFTRGSIRGVEYLMPKIMHECNCVLAHTGVAYDECHGFLHTVAGKKKAIAYLIYWEGWRSIEAYLLMMIDLLKGSQAEEMYRLAEEVHKESQADAGR